MQLVAQDMSRTEAERLRDYRNRMGTKGRQRDAARKRRARATALPQFIGVDGEGTGKGKNHRYVLLGVGREQYENPSGINWQEAFEFLYKQFESNRAASFVGFFLGYDFNRLLATLPIHAARMLLTKQGRALRKITSKGHHRNKSHPVREGRWEIDMLGFKRLSIRPRPDGCYCQENKTKCTHKSLPWMHICDAGSFYQMSFINVIDPKKWAQDPDGPICSQAQYERIKRGKDKRSYALLDDDMRAYNVEENLLLADVMLRLAKGFASVGIKLARDQWYGPGATASQWLSKRSVKRSQLRLKDGKQKPLMPKWFWDACQASYYGGWFEIFSHGNIYGQSYNYDINNAYPYASTKLPHICRECRYTRGTGNYNGAGEYVLLHCTVFTKGDRIGAVPYRNKAGNILRPSVSKGWYWKFELDAARRANLVKRVMVNEWVEFEPCSHPKPFKEIYDLYYLRLKVGKASAQGMAIKLNNNSIYGKFAQSVGAAPYNNWLYASYITAHCRAQILDAIATHPGKADSVLMVATDGVCFDSPHPILPISKDLGEWEESEYTDLLLFKPGVYTHKEGKERLLKVKSRGVPKEALIEAIETAEYAFWAMQREGGYPGKTLWVTPFQDEEWFAEMEKRIGWPYFYVTVNFRMKSCAQALNEGSWDTAGEVQEKVPLLQDSDPQIKRKSPRFNGDKRRIDTIIWTLPNKEMESTPYGKEEKEKHFDMGYNFDSDAMGPAIEAMATLRDRPANYDLPIKDGLPEGYEWVKVWGD